MIEFLVWALFECRPFLVRILGIAFIRADLDAYFGILLFSLSSGPNKALSCGAVECSFACSTGDSGSVSRPGKLDGEGQ